MTTADHTPAATPLYTLTAPQALARVVAIQSANPVRIMAAWPQPSLMAVALALDVETSVEAALASGRSTGEIAQKIYDAASVAWASLQGATRVNHDQTRAEALRVVLAEHRQEEAFWVQAVAELPYAQLTSIGDALGVITFLYGPRRPVEAIRIASDLVDLAREAMAQTLGGDGPLAACGCPEVIIAEEGHQVGCAVRQAEIDRALRELGAWALANLEAIRSGFQARRLAMLESAQRVGASGAPDAQDQAATIRGASYAWRQFDQAAYRLAQVARKAGA